jgi:hypothetical protein
MVLADVASIDDCLELRLTNSSVQRGTADRTLKKGKTAVFERKQIHLKRVVISGRTK